MSNISNNYSENLEMRIAYIDVLKTFAIFLVVLGHVCQNYGKNIEIGLHHFCILPYHMPLFAILSGLFFNADIGFKSFFEKKFIQLALPFFVWCFITAIVIRGINETYLHMTEGFTIHFKSWIECYYMYVKQWGWWFIRALFLSFLYAYVSIRLCGRNVLAGICISILLLYTLSLSGIIPNRTGKDLVFLYPFFCTGILMKKYKDSIVSHANRLFPMSVIIFSVSMLLWQGYPDTFYEMNTSMLESQGFANITGWMVPIKMLYRYITGVSASLMLILLAGKFEAYLPKSVLAMSIGRNTLGIYILHGFVFQIFAPPSSSVLFEDGGGMCCHSCRHTDGVQ